jgi:hypothetical protein
MVDQGMAGFALRAVEGDFRPWEEFRGAAYPAGLNTAAPPWTLVRSDGCAKHLPNAKAGQFCLLEQVSDIFCHFL